MYFNKRQEINMDMITACYDAALNIYNKRLNKYGGIGRVINKTKMNPQSAEIYISAILNMINGDLYEKGIQILAVQKYIKFIERDFGFIEVKNAIESVKKHIQYVKQYDVNAVGLKELIDWIEYEQDEIMKRILGHSQPKVDNTSKVNDVTLPHVIKKVQYKDVVKLDLLDEDDTMYVYVDHYQDEELKKNYKFQGIELNHLTPDMPLAEKIMKKQEGDTFQFSDQEYKISKIERK